MVSYIVMSLMTHVERQWYDAICDTNVNIHYCGLKKVDLQIPRSHDPPQFA